MIGRKIHEEILYLLEQLTDYERSSVPFLHDLWVAGRHYAVNQIVRDQNGLLYRCITEHVSQTGWEPHRTPALFTAICEDHKGTMDDPIPYSKNMELKEGLYYQEDHLLYRCIRSSGQAVFQTLAELAGLYTEVVN